MKFLILLVLCMIGSLIFSLLPSKEYIHKKQNTKPIQYYIDKYLNDTKHIVPTIPNCLKGKQIFMTGTSYTRSIYSSIHHILTGVPYNRTGSKIIGLGSYKSHIVHTCADHKILGYERDGTPWCAVKDTPINCNLPGPAGIDLKKCGVPSFGGFKVKNLNVDYQFKTYIFTEEADYITLDRISKGKYDLIIAGGGEWGRNLSDKRYETHDEQAEKYVEMLSNIKVPIIWYYNSGYNRSVKALMKAVKRQGIPVMDIKQIVHEHYNVQKGHGYLGTITDKAAHIMLQSYCDSLQ